MDETIIDKKKVLRQLQSIPGIGKACANDLWNMGIRSIPELSGKNPRMLYEQLNALSGTKHDICMLYTFRCAVYYATEEDHDREKLHWWYWKEYAYNE
jgi:hypothetical protein